MHVYFLKNYVKSSLISLHNVRVNMELFLWNFQVALQFPDEIMRDAAQVAEKLGNATSQKIAILGDTSYGR